MEILKTALPYVISGISVGGQYALIAIGYTMVYGILRLINFAHGDVFMVAGLMMVYFTTWMPLYLAIPLMIAATVLLGFLIERVAYKPLRTAPRMSVMISAIGVSYFIQNMALYITGGLNKNYPAIPWISDPVRLFGMETSRVTVITPFLTIALVIALVLLINHTKIGMAMRAVSVDFETAQLMGIKINSVISATFIIGTFLAAVGSVLFFTNFPWRGADVRRNAWPEGVRGGGVRRHRLRTRRGGGRIHHRYLRVRDQGSGHHPDGQRRHYRAGGLCHILGCIHLCAADRHFGIQAHRPVR